MLFMPRSIAYEPAVGIMLVRAAYQPTGKIGFKRI